MRIIICQIMHTSYFKPSSIPNRANLDAVYEVLKEVPTFPENDEMATIWPLFLCDIPKQYIYFILVCIYSMHITCTSVIHCVHYGFLW